MCLLLQIFNIINLITQFLHNHKLSFLDVRRLENSIDDVFKNGDGPFMLFLSSLSLFTEI